MSFLLYRGDGKDVCNKHTYSERINSCSVHMEDKARQMRYQTRNEHINLLSMLSIKLINLSASKQRMVDPSGYRKQLMILKLAYVVINIQFDSV